MLSREDLLELRVATLESLLQLLYVDHLWEPQSPYRLVDFFAGQIHRSLLADEAHEGPAQEAAIAMTELADVFFQQVRAQIMQRIEREKHRRQDEA